MYYLYKQHRNGNLGKHFLNQRHMMTICTASLQNIHNKRIPQDLDFPGRGGSSYNGLNREALPERGTFFRLQVYKRVGVSQVEVYKRVGNWSFRYLKGPLTIIFQIHAHYGCIS